MVVRLLDAVSRVFTFASITIFAALAIPVSYDAVSRSLKAPSIWVFDVSLYLLIAAAFLGNALALRSGAHFRMVFLFKLFPAWRRFGDRLAFGATALFAAATLWLTIRYVQESWDYDLHSGTILNAPLWLPQLAMPLGALALLLEACRILLTGEYPDVTEG